MILLYHKISVDNPSLWWVDVDNFYRQMYELQNRKVVFLDDYDSSNEDHVVLTFDGIYKNVLEYAAPMLQKFKYPFELFVTSNYLGKDNKWDGNEPYAEFANIDDLKRLVRMGGRLQWHTQSHPDMDQLEDIKTIQDELSVPTFLSEIDPEGFKWFAFPHGNYSPTVLTEVGKRFRGSLSCNQGKNHGRDCLKRVIVSNNTKFRRTSVAVIIASYNYGAFLIESIESVLRQTILPNEILITDDCSEDSTQEIAVAYQKKYPHIIKYNRNEINLGVVENFNKAVSLTNSDYILFLGADNRFLSNYIEETKAILDSSEEIGISYTDFALFGPRARLAYNRFSENLKGKIKKKHYIINFPEWNEQSKESLQKSNFIHGSSMYKRKAYDEIGGYQEGTTNAEDHDLFLRMVRHGWEARKASSTFLEYRQHSRAQRNTILQTYSELIFYKERYKALLDEKQKVSRLLLFKIMMAYLVLKEEGFKEFLRRAVKFLKEKFLNDTSKC